MTTTEQRIIAVEAELNQATQQVTVWRERQLMAQGALNVLRVIASEGVDENPTDNPIHTDNDTSSVGQ